MHDAAPRAWVVELARVTRFGSFGRAGAVALALIVGATLVTTGGARADVTTDVPVRLGEISASPSDAPVLRASFESALRAQTFPAPKPGVRGARAIVSVAVLDCDDHRCGVSAVVRDATRGGVLAVLRGSARSPSPAAREALLRSAAAGAARQVPAALPR
ncbi:MAG: hypothetical protein IPF92_28690 [Myxococcales bacterium]|jgi:hypothetical protein|nr:hypothetical protein [Myxococcales bacterium]MBL0196476.1 hypothetical protein [Myxococcales bacterium]HQY61973.1 hypothetical protein [Polyangiaceae bacterium]